MKTYRRPENPSYESVTLEDKKRNWKRILIIDDDPDVTTTFKVG